MKPPDEYIEIMKDFLNEEYKGVKFEKCNREDMAAFKMAAYLLDLPIDVIMKKNELYLIRKQMIPNANRS